MFDPTSRYYRIKDAELTVTDPDGTQRIVKYKKRRFLPDSEAMPVLVEVKVTQGDRLDLISARTLGTGEQFWRICDANNVLDPAELTEEPGRIIRVPVPQPE